MKFVLLLLSFFQIATAFSPAATFGVHRPSSPALFAGQRDNDSGGGAALATAPSTLFTDERRVRAVCAGPTVVIRRVALPATFSTTPISTSSRLSRIIPRMFCGWIRTDHWQLSADIG